jgi:hypothetical protein
MSMAWVAVGTAVVGTAGSIAASSASANATKKAGQLSQKGADAATQAQQNQYYQSREDFRPFLQPSNRAMASLQSALYGGEFEYDDPTTSAISPEDLAAENWKAISADRGTYNHSDFWKDIGNGEDPIGRLTRGNNWLGPYNGMEKWYRGADGQLTTTAPKRLTASFQPMESEGFKYIKGQTLADLGRQLRMMGRGSGTVAANATGRTLGNLNAANEQQQYGRLTDVAKIGQGAAGSVGAAGSSMAGNVGNIAMSNAGTQAGLTQQNGPTMANLYSGIGPTLSNAYGTYLMGQYLNKPAPAAH